MRRGADRGTITAAPPRPTPRSIELSCSILRKMGFGSPLVRLGYPPLIRELLDAAGLSAEEKEEVLKSHPREESRRAGARLRR